MCKASTRRASGFAAILLAPLLMATTYKWVDPQGQVHFTDSPPPTGIAYEIVAPPHSPVAPYLATPAPVVPAAVAEAVPAPTAHEAAGTAQSVRDDLRCVDALFQLQVLAGDWKVYKRGPDNVRTYLNDRDRPLEVSRLSVERDANCSADPDVLASQKRRARELFQALSPDCREAREKLENLQRPTARSAPSDIEKQETYIRTHCPEVSRGGVWLADWIWVRRR
jgi:hypothetical protein